MENAVQLTEQNEQVEVSNEEVQPRRVIKVTSDMEIPTYGVEKTEEYKSVEQFINLLPNFRFNDPIQRSADAWGIDRKSLLIVSVLEEISIGEITVQVIKGNKRIIRNVLDGKQRLTTLRDFCKGKFALKPNCYVMGYDENGDVVWYDVEGLYFDDLPAFYKRRIMASMIKFDLYDIDDEMKFELFQRRNNGVVLKPAQLRKSKMTYPQLHALAELKELPIFMAGFSPKAINDDTHADMILKAMAVILTDNNTALGNTDLNKFLDEKSFVPALLDQFKVDALYVNEAFPLLDEKQVSKCFGNSKTISLMYVANIAKREGRSVEEFATWMVQFFVKDYAKSNFGSQSGTAKLESVKRRNDIIVKHYRNFFTTQAA